MVQSSPSNLAGVAWSFRAPARETIPLGAHRSEDGTGVSAGTDGR